MEGEMWVGVVKNRERRGSEWFAVVEIGRTFDVSVVWVGRESGMS